MRASNILATSQRQSGQLTRLGSIRLRGRMRMVFGGRYQMPFYTGPNGWVTLDVKEAINCDEVRATFV